MNARASERRKRYAAFEEKLFADFEQNGADAIEKMRNESPVKYVQIVEAALARKREAPADEDAEHAAASPADEDEPVLSEAEREQRAAYIEALRAGIDTEPGDEG
jgi:hypothetical protein